MKTTGVMQVSVATTPECEEPVTALLETIFGEFPSGYTNVETQQTAVTVFLRRKPAEIKSLVPQVERGLDELKKLGLNTAPASIRVDRVRREDWSESWKKYFKTIEVGKKLMIKPSWSKHKPALGQAVVVLDPGLSFGTGQHATTSFCLREVVYQTRSRRKPAMIDIGCGSGILAICAAKLGYSPIEAFDFDPVAVRVAKKNCDTNRVTRKVLISKRDLTKLALNSRARFDVVCANIISTLLIEQRDKILNWVAPGGVVVLAGILATEFASVQKAYERAGWELIRTKAEREWQSGTFKKRN